MASKSSPSRLLLVAVVVAGLAASACSTFRGVTVSSDGTPKPTPIPARTLPPTPGASGWLAIPPSPALSPAPTLEPGKSRRVSYSVFRERVLAAQDDMLLILGSIERHSDPLDVPRLVSDLEDGAAWATELTAWLQRNQPRPCYEVRHAALTAAVAKYQEGFGLMASALTTLDEPRLRQGLSIVDQAGSILETAEADTCGGQHSAG
jgi:hypothetical protein